MRRAIVLVCLCICAFAQTNNKGQTVNLTSVPGEAITRLSFYDASGNEAYRCSAIAVQPTYTWRKSDTTLTQIVVSSNTGTVTTASAHGLAAGNRVVVAGSTTAELNATYVVQTVPSTTTFTVTTSGVGDATYNNAALTVASNAPRTTANVWSVERWTFVGSSNDKHQWAYDSIVLRGARPELIMGSICDNRETLAYQ